MTERGPDGQLLRQKYKKGSYAEEKFKMLEEERKRFNVDAFGRYKGGCNDYISHLYYYLWI